MARGLRIQVPDGWYHVMSRGNGGEAIFRNDDDRQAFLRLAGQLPGHFGAEIHAFVLMDNHYHLLLRGRPMDLGETLRWLQTAYAVRFNWAHRRRGHVLRIPAAFGRDSDSIRTGFRPMSDSVPEFAGQDSGSIRTAIRGGSDRVPGYSDSFSPP